MKKLLLVLLGATVFACGGNHENDSTREDNTIDAEVQEGAGKEISPQLEMDADSSENLEVDTISTATGASQRKKQ